MAESAEVKSRAKKTRDPESLDEIIDTGTLAEDMHYRFVHERPQRIARMKAKGYRIVLSEEDGVKPIVEDIISPDGSIRDGDTVLMCVPKERFEAGRAKLAAINKARMAAPKQNFRKKTRRAAPSGEDVKVVTTDKTDKE